jgi:hypothetical protein
MNAERRPEAGDNVKKVFSTMRVRLRRFRDVRRRALFGVFSAYVTLK